MNFKRNVQESFSTVKKDMTDLKLTTFDLITELTKNQIQLQERLMKLESQLEEKRILKAYQYR